MPTRRRPALAVALAAVQVLSLVVATDLLGADVAPYATETQTIEAIGREPDIAGRSTSRPAPERDVAVDPTPAVQQAPGPERPPQLALGAEQLILPDDPVVGGEVPGRGREAAASEALAAVAADGGAADPQPPVPGGGDPAGLDAVAGEAAASTSPGAVAVTPPLQEVPVDPGRAHRLATAGDPSPTGAGATSGDGADEAAASAGGTATSSTASTTSTTTTSTTMTSTTMSSSSVGATASTTSGTTTTTVAPTTWLPATTATPITTWTATTASTTTTSTTAAPTTPATAAPTTASATTSSTVASTSTPATTSTSSTTTTGSAGGGSGAGYEAIRNTDPRFSRFAGVPSAQLSLAELTVPAVRPDNGTVGDGQFRAACQYSHFANDDPIVYPGQPGRSHLHMFFGNTETDAFSTTESLVNRGGGTCNGFELNRSAYWTPALLDGRGNAVVPDMIVLYYKTKEPGKVQRMPQGLRMLTGNTTAESFSTSNFLYWSCGGSGKSYNKTNRIPDCNGDTINATISFPQCWDGRNLDSADHRSHLKLVSPHTPCPASHPVTLPQISILLYFPGQDSVDGWHLSSDRSGGFNTGPGATLHADWWGAWNDETMDLWIQGCMVRARNCSFGQTGTDRQLAKLNDRQNYDGPNFLPLP